MPEARDSAWLRKTLCDEIESLRAGHSDHVRAKGVALLAREVLKSVEVELTFRGQQAELSGTGHEKLGALPLCGAEEPESEPQASLPSTREPIRSPIVKPGARFVPGRNATGGM